MEVVILPLRFLSKSVLEVVWCNQKLHAGGSRLNGATTYCENEMLSECIIVVDC